MAKKIKRFIAFLMAASMLAAQGIECVYAREKTDLLVNESFNECITNGDIPETITKNGDRIIIKEYAKNEKGVYIAKQGG